MNWAMISGIVAIYSSVALPALIYVVRIETRLTRIETMIANTACPLVKESDYRR